MNLHLQLRRTKDASEAAAWLIASASPQVWLDHLCSWEAKLETLGLLPVPASTNDTGVGGVLVLAPTGFAVPPSALVQAYACVAPSLYLPADAELCPPTVEAELRDILPGDLQVFLPAVGLVACRMEQLLRVSDLLTSPPRQAAAFDCALEATYLNTRIERVEPQVAPDALAAIDGGREDIGLEPPNNLKPLREESSGGRAAAQAAAGAWGAAGWLAGTLAKISAGKATSPHILRASGTRPPPARLEAWLQKLQQWAQMHASQAGRALDQARNKELARLLQILERDPDRGLRYALPLTGEGVRGLANPGSRLSAHGIEFSLSNVRGASDPWALQNQIRQQLLAKYREAASRELALQRYRRAAYIYARLLGDSSSAANALKQGRFFREAAVLYRDHLKKPVAAAECLTEGGLLQEALESYQQLGHHEKAGDLHLRLEQPDLARSAYLTAVSIHIRSAEYLEAARLHQEKLQEPDEALKTYALAWPHSTEALACLRKRFALLAQLGRHEQARVVLQEIGRNLPAVPHLAATARGLGELAETYPAPPIQAEAADLARVIIGQRLGSAAAAEQELLLSTLRGLAREDELLQRDCSRFLQQQRHRRPQPIPLKPVSRAKQSSAVRTIQLDEQFRWLRAFSTGEWFCAVGTAEDRLLLVCSDFTGLRSAVEWPAAISDEWLLLQHLPQRQHILLAHRGRPDLMRPKAIPPAGARPGLTAGPLPGVELEGVLAASLDEQSTLWALRPGDKTNEVTLSALDPQTGQLRLSHAIFLPKDEEAGTGEWRLAAHGLWRVMANGRHLAAHYNQKMTWTSQTLGHPVRSVLPCPVLSARASWFAACLEYGVCIVTPSAAQREHVPIAKELANPVPAFTCDGKLVVVGDGEGHVYSNSAHRVEQIGRFATNVKAPAAVFATANAGEIALLHPHGLVTILELPRQSRTP